jgi:hypothetical protein
MSAVFFQEMDIPVPHHHRILTATPGTMTRYDDDRNHSDEKPLVLVRRHQSTAPAHSRQKLDQVAHVENARFNKYLKK